MVKMEGKVVLGALHDGM